MSTYILFSSYGKGNNGSYLELAIGKQNMTERLNVKRKVLGRALRSEVESGQGNHEHWG